MYSNPIHNPLNEKDIRSFLREAPRCRFDFFSTALPSVLIAMAVCGILFFSLNAQSFFMINSITPENAAAAAIITPTPAPTAHVANPVVADSTPAPVVQAPVTPSIPNNTLSVSDLGISAPITWSVPLDIKTQSKLLNQGLVHIAGTALPGEKGMSAISGHSSNYPWIKSSYNSVFAPLLKSQVGQTIEINYNSTLYTYRITKKYEVKPDQVSVLEDNTATGIRLITCTPVGTSLRRLIVDAEQITPDPVTNTNFSPSTFSAPALTGR